MLPEQEIRVLHLDAGNIYGGIETLLVTLGRSQGIGGLRHSYFLTSEGRLLDELRFLGVPVGVAPAVRLRRPASVWRARRMLAQLLEEARPTIVVAHGPWSLVVFGPAVRKAAVPLVFFQHGAVSGHWLERLAALVPIQLRLAASFFIEANGRRLFPRTASNVVRPPVPPPVRRADRSVTRRALGLPADAVVLLQASRLEACKGHLLLAQGLTRVPSGTPWVWVVAGTRPSRAASALEQKMRQTLRKAGCEDRLRVLGERDDVPALLDSADILCQPSLKPEGFGIVFIEALYAGLSIVTTTSAGGALEFLDASVAEIVEPDADALARALTRLIGDASARERLASGGPERAASICEPSRAISALASALRGTCKPAHQGQPTWV